MESDSTNNTVGNCTAVWRIFKNRRKETRWIATVPPFFLIRLLALFVIVKDQESTRSRIVADF
jgi:hypothetical protein